MTVESLVFIGLGLLVVVLTVKLATGEQAKQKHGANEKIGQFQALEVHIVGKENTPSGKNCAPTAELQTIDNIEAIQRVQILISKGQTIEAVQYLCDNAGYDKQRALALVDSMGKKVYSAD